MPKAHTDRDATTRREKIIQLARTIEERADETLPLASLAKEVGLSPARLQKAFKDLFGVSPKAYQDAARMRQFKESLRQGRGVTDAIYDSGYGSVSRVYGNGKRNLSMTPTSYRAGAQGELISYAHRETSLGLVLMAATDQGVCFVQFGEDLEQLVSALQHEFPNATLEASKAQQASELDRWMAALEQHIGGSAPSPEVPLDLRGTAFQISVWQFLRTIPEGQVLSYGEVAERIGKPKAIRAVGTACGKNRIGLLVPCHRVLRGDGQLGGYRWGLERKRRLLEQERKRASAIASRAADPA